jgi:hypothetical protein
VIQDLYPLDHDAAVRLGRRMQLRHLGSHSYRVADMDRCSEAPAADLEQSHQRPVEEPGALAQTRGEREDERAVRDPLAVDRLRSEVRVRVQRVEVTRDAGERDQVGLRYRPTCGLEAKADLDVLEVERHLLAHSWGVAGGRGRTSAGSV